MSQQWSDMFGPTLKTKNGVKPTKDVLAGKKVVGLYFSAHWCPPCRAFTPQLAVMYEEMLESVNEFEIVFISSDRDEASYESYYSEMPWTAVPLEKSDIKAALSSKHGVSGIPCLIFIDGNGNVIEQDGRSLVMQAIKGQGASGLWKDLQSRT